MTARTAEKQADGWGDSGARQRRGVDSEVMRVVGGGGCNQPGFELMPGVGGDDCRRVLELVHRKGRSDCTRIVVVSR